MAYEAIYRGSHSFVFAPKEQAFIFKYIFTLFFYNADYTVVYLI